MRSSPKARALAAALAPLAVAACSALISHADGQCATDADCVRFGATTCVRGGCVVASPPVDASFTPDGSEACATTSDCLQLHPEGSWFCRHVDQTCVDLKSTDCPQVLGDYTADDALLLGALVPVFGPTRAPAPRSPEPCDWPSAISSEASPRRRTGARGARWPSSCATRATG